MKKRFWCAALLAVIGFRLSAQEVDDKQVGDFWSRLFLSSVDVGYQVQNADLISNSVRIGTSIEYRIRNNNDFFIRMNYDTYGSAYVLSNGNNTTNTIEGTVQFTDVVSGIGYRLGDNTFRMMISVMPGIKLYEFPTAVTEGQRIIVRQESKTTFTSIFLVTLEYYVDQKSALTFSIYQNQVWKSVDFWQNDGSAFGVSLGFITSLL